MPAFFRPALRLAAPIALLLAAAGGAQAQDAARGETVFKRVCAVCHMVGPDAKNRLGPVLNGIVGRKAGTIAGFAYSPANKNSDVTWGETELKSYLRDPKAFMPGNRMIYAGLRNDADLGDLVAYLGRFDADGRSK